MTSPTQRKLFGAICVCCGFGGSESLVQNSFVSFVARLYVSSLSVEPSLNRSSNMPRQFRVDVDVSVGTVCTSARISGVQSPPTPLMATAPRPPRPPPGTAGCTAAPRPPPPLPRPPRPAAGGAVIAAEPAAPAAPITPTAVTPNGEPGRRENANRLPSCDQVGAASRSTPGNGNVTVRVFTS